MDYKISNGIIEGTISDKGAELKSLRFCGKEENFIWGADPEYWGKSSPVLFPFVGVLKDNMYTYKNKIYNISSRHGFARDMEFELVEKKEGEVTFKLSWDEETLKIYPFKFEFYMTYTLQDKELKINYRVVNLEDELMYFSLGTHPAFSTPTNATTKFEDYYLEFAEKETAEIYVLENNLVSNKKEPFLDNSDVITLSENLFENDAIIFEGLKSKTVSLKCKTSSRAVNVDYSNFRYIAFWNVPGAQFVCIEPWFGITDFYNADGKLENKVGIQSLEANGEFQADLKIGIDE